jgi:Sulfite reductase, alpha subunit (flavoprotein)
MHIIFHKLHIIRESKFSITLLQLLSNICGHYCYKESAAYEDWRHWRIPHLLEVLEEFPSVRPSPALLAAQLTPLQPRFYSISSSPIVQSGQIHITVAVVSYRTQGGHGEIAYPVIVFYCRHQVTCSIHSLYSINSHRFKAYRHSPFILGCGSFQ